MLNVDSPGFPFALLAILAGLRLAVYVYHRLYAPALEPVTTALAPDETVEPAVISTVGNATAIPAGNDTTFPSAESYAAVPGDSPTTDKAETERTTVSHFISELLDSGIIAVILVFFIIRPFVLQAFFIPTGSMIPTLREGDRLLATKFVYHFTAPKRGDVVVFDAPPAALRLQSQTYDPGQPVEYVKRVVGVPSDRIRIKAYDGVYVNGEKLDEPYVNDAPNYDFPISSGSISITDDEVEKQLRPHIKDGVLTVPEQYLFVLGDNRQESLDGHMWGLLERKRVIGKAVYIFWPFERKGAIR
ncbi:MAG: signal peptidase I [Armatimonadota bacterium]